MTTFLLIISIVLFVFGLGAIFGAFGYAMFNIYRSIDIVASGDHDAVRKATTSVTKSTVASVAAIIFGGAISIFGWVMMVIVMSFAVVTP